jgi:hypothetical protein
MAKKLFDLDLANAVVDAAKRKMHDPGFLIVPVRVKTRMKGASASARSLLLGLLELRRDRKLIVTNELAEECGVSRKLKRRALEELAARQIIVLHPQEGRKNPRFEFVPGVLN